MENKEKSSEKEPKELTREELASINGGTYYVVRLIDGKPILIEVAD